jgi:signal transduction histidine kinase
VTTREGAPVDVRSWGAARVLQGQTIVGEELVVRHPDGREIPMLVSAAPLREEDGRITGGVAALQDITSLYEVDRLKSEFVSIVSHELRTPLTSIKGALQLLIDEGLAADPDHAMLLNVALSNTERLVRIINDILDISKIEAGKLELNARPHAVADVVKQSLQNVEPIAHGALVGLKADIEAGVPAVQVDLDRVIQVLVNLLSNAIKYTDQGTVSVEWTLEESTATVRVRDTGIGIPDDHRTLLFQPFHRATCSRSRTREGTGLGLAICDRLVREMGGAIGYESAPGAGSVFWFTLPLSVPLVD